jgi:hypothetical protein
MTDDATLPTRLDTDPRQVSPIENGAQLEDVQKAAGHRDHHQALRSARI